MPTLTEITERKITAELTLLGHDEASIEKAKSVVRGILQLHSEGLTVPQVVSLVNGEPLTPLTIHDRWIRTKDPNGNTIEFNARYHSLKRIGGRYFDTQFYVFRDPDGECYVQEDESECEVTLPYTPNPVYIDVEEPAF